ncbi:phosphoribosyl-AMP cyclohydrolase [Candidatus Bathyarchaeota archaeon]|nr:phosphoribosyl-AMP cyclohydrolase [Candidatus Bathyarchaeota archaeon]
MEISELKFDPRTSLIPVVTQDWLTKEVLMVAYANKEALRRAIETGYAHYWSRSRGRLWRKGETSGNTQTLKDILIDCDHDTILFLVEQKGPACHTGARTCFHNKLSRSIPRV